MQVSPELVEVRESGAPASRWQQPFDAALTDVFQVQSDIATKVAQALGVALGAGEEKRLVREAHAEPRRLRRLPEGRGGVERPGRRRSAQPAQGARLLRAGRGARSRLCAGVGESLVRQFAPVRQQHARRPRSRSAPGRRRRRPSRSRRTARRGTWRSATTNGWLPWTSTAPWSSTRRGCASRPATPSLLSGTALAEQGLGRWDAARGALQAGGAPRSPVRRQPAASRRSAPLRCGAIPRRGKLSTAASPSRPPTSV